MSSTLNRVLYGLRPAKNIERKMMCDIFALLARIRPLSRYRYVGMGALGFHDHALFHRRLGIRDMVSIEENVEWRGRVQLNRPYKCIKMEWGHTNDCLPTLSWKKPAIVWLDYDDPLDRSMLDDVHTVTANVVSGSMLVVTVTAHPENFDPAVEAPAYRLSQLIERVGEEKVPLATKGKDLSGWGLATVSKRIILNEVADVLSQRSGAEKPERKLSFAQLFNFRYADRAKMVTVGGVIATPSDHVRFAGPGLGDFDFVRRDEEEALELQVPNLTLRELKYLNQRLPNTPSSLKKLKKIPHTHVERYRQLYRYFPAFTEIETSV